MKNLILFFVLMTSVGLFTVKAQDETLSCNNRTFKTEGDKVYEQKEGNWEYMGYDVIGIFCQNGQLHCVHKEGYVMKYDDKPHHWSKTVINTLSQGESVNDGHVLVSANGEYGLAIHEGKLVIGNTRTDAIIWEQGGNSAGAKLLIQDSDGHLCLHNSEGGYVWCAPFSLKTQKVVLEDDGTLVAYNTEGNKTWSSK